MGSLSNTPRPPYYAVIFTSKRTPGDNGYAKTAAQMLELAEKQEGFLGTESVREESGFGMTVSYWASMESIERWKHNMPHQKAKALGKKLWYEAYGIRICRVESDHFFDSPR